MSKPVQRRHFIKWVPKAWRGDLELRSCSLAARGLWAELLMVMHDCEPYGHLVVNGRAPDLAAIGRLVGTSTSEAKKLLAELEAARVFSRTPEGVIYSRRFVEDERAYIAACEHGLKGGNPSLKPAAPLEVGLTPPVGEPDNRPLRARADAHSPVRVSEFSETQKEHAARVLRTREDEPAPPAKPIPPRLAAPSVLDPEPAPSLTLRAREQIALHPVLDVAPVHAAALRWENHLREHGRLDAWKSGTWAANLAKWARWGPSRTVVAIDTTIGCGLFTPFEPTHRDAPAPTAAQSPAVTRERSDRAAYERDLERRWEAQHTVERDVASPLGGTVKRLVLDAKYPGHEAAERELGARGPAGTPDVRKSA